MSTARNASKIALLLEEALLTVKNKKEPGVEGILEEVSKLGVPPTVRLVARCVNRFPQGSHDSMALEGGEARTN